MTKKKTPSKIKRTVERRFERLKNSERRFEDIYNILFEDDGVFTETSGSVCGITEYSFAEARRDIERLSKGIAEEVGWGNFVGLSMKNSTEWLVTFWAILKSGNKPYLINRNQPKSFCASVEKRLGADYVITLEREEGPGAKNLIYSELMAKEGRSEPACFGNEIALTTGGTTQREKICIYSGAELSAQLLNSRQLIKWNRTITHCSQGGFKMLMILPLYHIFGLEAAYFWMAFFSASFVFAESLAPETLLRTARFHDVSHIFAVPLFFHSVEKSLMRELEARGEGAKRRFERGIKLSLWLQNISPRLGVWLAARLFSEIREELFGDSVYFCITGGSHIKPSALRLLNGIGYPLYNGYGMSELGIASVDFSRRPKARLRATVGKPFSSVEYRIDEKGCLQVRGESACKKLILNGVPTRVDDFFDTEDMAERESDGRYRILGRYNDIVIGENGENLNPDLCEEAFELRHILEYTVLGDEKKEKLILVIRPEKGLNEEEGRELSEDIERGISALPPAYNISRVLFTNDPLTADGEIKVSRTKLAGKIETGAIKLFENMGEAKESLCGGIAVRIREIVAEILGITSEEVGDTDHFMNDLGGTSLDYFAIINRINEEYAITLSYEEKGFRYDLVSLVKKVEEFTEQ